MRFSVLALLLCGCASLPPLKPGLVLRVGASNGKQNQNRLGVLEGYAFEGLRVGVLPVTKNRTAHPIIGGDKENGFITKGLANRLPDKERLTQSNYSGFVLAQEGLDWRFIR